MELWFAQTQLSLTVEWERKKTLAELSNSMTFVFTQAQERWRISKTCRKCWRRNNRKTQLSKMVQFSWSPVTISTGWLATTTREDSRWTLFGAWLFSQVLTKLQESSSLASAISMALRLNMITCTQVSLLTIAKCWWPMAGEQTWQRMKPASLWVTVRECFSTVTKKHMIRSKSLLSLRMELQCTNPFRLTQSGRYLSTRKRPTNSGDLHASTSEDNQQSLTKLFALYI